MSNIIRKPGIWIAIAFLLLAVISGYLYIIETGNTTYKETTLVNATSRFKADLRLFLNDVEQTAGKLKEDTRKVYVDQVPVDSLNLYFSMLTGKKSLLFGVLVFGKENKYVIFRDQDTWIYTLNSIQDSIIIWKRIDKNLEPVPNGEWTETANSFLNSKNYGAVRDIRLRKNNYMWFSAQSTLPERYDLLFNLFTIGPDEDPDAVALIYKTTEFSSRFTQVLRFENPLVSVITEDDKLVSPIRTKDTLKVNQFRQLETIIKKNYVLWNEIAESPNTFSFEEFKMMYYTRFDTIDHQLGVKAFALTVSDQDLELYKAKVEEAYLYVFILFVLFAIFAFYSTIRKHRPSFSGKSLQQLKIADINMLIQGGETEHVEFKSSLRWDYHEEKVNKLLEVVIMKSIAAFANSKGGVLFIGVKDDKEIIGLTPDFATLKKQDVDYFELHLRKLINNQFGISFTNSHLLIQFPEIDGKACCVIQIKNYNKPLYVKLKNKQGQEVEKFYVRSGNASQEMSSLAAINEYVKNHFKKQV